MEIPLRPKIAREILSSLRPLLAKAGYTRKENVWYEFSPELVKVLEFESGSFKPKAYFNLGFAIRTKTGPVQPRIFDCSVYGRLDVMVEELSGICDFGPPRPDVEVRIEKIVKAVETVALPFLNSIQTLSDLRRDFSIGRLRGFTISREMRDLLSGISP